MKMVTWNINSVRLRLNLLKKLIEEHQPDIIALQEIKTINDYFPYQDIKDMGYPYMHFSGQKSYNGVAIISKLPFTKQFSLELYNEDKRHVAVEVSEVEIHNFYVPAGGDIPDIELNEKFKHKLEYVKLAEEWFLENRSKDNKIVLMGDLNIAPYEHDVWSSKSLRNVVSHTDIERASLIKFQNSLGFIDTSRHIVPFDQKFYTWWSYRNKDWQKSNRGRKLDHAWTSTNLQDNILSINSLREARDWLQPSDHVPYFLNLKI
ncbi:MAG: exodeoxyribonuclease III [Candidatus Rickettsia vulgarisii]